MTIILGSMEQGSQDSYDKGRVDCIAGRKAREDADSEYIEGYGNQYQLEQARGESCQS